MKKRSVKNGQTPEQGGLGAFRLDLDEIRVDRKKNARLEASYTEGNIEPGYEQASLRALGRSIKRIGQIQPCTVVQGKKGWELIAGFRRYFACKLEGIPKLYVIEWTGSTIGVNAAENIARKNFHAVEIAFECARLKSEDRLSDIEIGNCVGLERPSVSNYIGIMRNTHNEILSAWKKTPGAFSVRLMLDISKLASADQLEWYHGKMETAPTRERAKRQRSATRALSRSALDQLRSAVQSGEQYEAASPEWREGFIAAIALAMGEEK